MYFLSYMEFRLFVFFTCCNVCVRSCVINNHTLKQVMKTNNLNAIYDKK